MRRSDMAEVKGFRLSRIAAVIAVGVALSACGTSRQSGVCGDANPAPTATGDVDALDKQGDEAFAARGDKAQAEAAIKAWTEALKVAPSRPDIRHADARKLPLADESVDFAFIDPPYSTHVDYSDDPRCIGKLDASGEDGGDAYYQAMGDVIEQLHRTLKNRRYMAVYVSDSWRKRAGSTGVFMPIGFELFGMLRRYFKPVDIIAVVRHNQKLGRGNWRKAAEEGNFFLRGFNYLFIMKK